MFVGFGEGATENARADYNDLSDNSVGLGREAFVSRGESKADL